MKKSLLALSIILSTSAFADYKITLSGKGGNIKLPEAPEEISQFTGHTFTSCGQEGRFGPSLSQCQTEYSGSEILSGDYGFDVNQGIQSFVIPETGEYRITTYGPEGYNNNGNVGKGAIMEGTFVLSSGTKIHILVGQQHKYMGTQSINGGSGGTFVALGNSISSSRPLVVSGGGGTNNRSNTYNSIMNASTGTTGKNGTGSSGGSNGNGASGGGHNNDSVGGGAAGFYGNGIPKGDLRDDYGPFMGAQSFVNGGLGGEFNSTYASGNSLHGGFGGGGSAGWYGSGGGGGYSGGGNSDNVSSNGYRYGGGGGSFISSDAIAAGTSDGLFQRTGSEPTPAYSGSIQNLGGFNSGKGKVVIEKL